MKHKILCLGDSNTFGYNPCSPLSSRYSSSVRWTGILNSGDSWEIVNSGENGREIPYRDWELERVDSALDRAKPDGVLVMLGTNDLLSNVSPEAASQRMLTLLEHLLKVWQEPRRLILVSPVHMVKGLWAINPELPKKALFLSELYHQLARDLGISFVDAHSWETAMAFDGVHLNPEGHKTVAQEMDKALTHIFHT